MQEVHREVIDGVTYTVSIDFDGTEVRGNASACGDDAVDKRYEDEIIKRLDDGDDWAWALVRVRAEVEGHSADEYLGGCTYKDTKEFVEDGYYADMKSEALKQLRTTVERAYKALHKEEVGCR